MSVESSKKFKKKSSCIISLRTVTTDLDLLSCTSRKDKTNSDLIRNVVLLWNNIVLCVIFKYKRLQFQFHVSMQSSVLFWSWLITCSFHVSLLFNLSVKLLSELMIFSSALMNFRFVVDFDLHKREKFRFSIFDLRCSHLWSYWVE